MAKKAESAHVITIKDVGPITEHVLTIVPGVTVISGQNEVGKSTAILATAALAGRKEADLSVRDGCKSGMVQGLGTTLLVGKRCSRAGELEVDSVEDRIDLASLVDPGLKQPAAATKKRIKALISLTGTKLDVADFSVILPESMQGEILQADADDDPVDMAGKIKRRMESKAREMEEQATEFETKALGAKRAFDGVDLDAPHDSAALQQVYSDALQEKGSIDAQVKAAATRAEEIASAKRTLATAEGAGNGLAEAETQLKRKQDALAQANAAYNDSKANVEAAQRQVDESIRLLSSAKAAASQTMATRDAASDALASQEKTVAAIKRETSHLAELRKLAEAVAPEAPSEDDVAAAREAAEKAFSALEQASKVREGLKAKEEHDKHRKAQADYLEKANIFRQAAAATDEVLSNAVAAKTLKVVAGELCYVEGDRNEPYARLSDGKRYQVAILEIARAIHATSKRLAVVPLNQQAWEGLDDANRKIVNGAAVECNICIVTAEAGSGPLTSYLFGGAN